MSFSKSPSNITWRVSNIIQIPIGILFIAISFWYPESPRYLLEKHPEDLNLCLQTLAKVRSGTTQDDNIRMEFHEIVASKESRKGYTPGYMGIFKDSSMRKRLLYGVYATGLQQIGGIACITIYAASVYESMGWNQDHQALAINGVLSVLQVLVVLINTFAVDRFGRRPLLLGGFAIQALALLVLASLTTSHSSNENMKGVSVAELAMLFIVGVTYCKFFSAIGLSEAKTYHIIRQIGWSNGPIAPIIATEIFPQHVRDKAVGISLMGQAACLVALAPPWPRFNQETGGKSYWLLFLLNAIALVRLCSFVNLM